MKVEVKEKDVKPFPKLMEHNGIIILATSFKDEMYEGMVISNINNIDHHHVGDFGKFWSSNFRDFPGTVTLSND